jgi:hypothetical protein
MPSPRRTLRAVPTPTAPMTILEAAEADDRMGELRAMRRRIAGALDSEACPPRDMAALSRRLIEVGREIDAMRVAAAQEGDADERDRTAAPWDEATI